MATATTKTRSRRKSPTVRVTMAKFDFIPGTPEIYRVARENVPIKEFALLTRDDYVPRGGTPLRDAVARFVAHLDGLRAPDCVTLGLLFDETGSMGGKEDAVIAGANKFVAGMADVAKVDPEAAGTVLAVIVTDGLENSSREVDPQTLAATIADREKNGWTFIFLGASIDAWAQGASLGFSGGVTGQTISTVNTPMGTTSGLAAAAADATDYLSNVGSYREQRTNSASSLRSVTESGKEVLTNINAPVTTSGFAEPTSQTYGDVAEALKKAKARTES